MPESFDQRLSRISTLWTVVQRAHAGSVNAELTARGVLMERYHGAVYRYLFGAVRDPDAADDLFQEFALRFVSGAFRNADPSRGRFRDFVKRSLVNLITDYRKAQFRRERPLVGDAGEPVDSAGDEIQSDELFLSSWREDLMARAWAGLAELQNQGGAPFHAVLHFRATNPHASSDEMARQLNEQLKSDPAFTDQSVRKSLQRARDKFADLLLDEVICSLEESSLDNAEQELIELGLLSYCRSALMRRRNR